MNENYIIEEIDSDIPEPQSNTNGSEKNPSDLINDLLMSEMYDEMYTENSFLINQALCDRCKESIQKNRKITYEKEIQTDVELPQKRAREEISCEKLNQEGVVEVGESNGSVYDITDVPVASTLARPPPTPLRAFSMMPPALNYMPYNPLNRPYMPTIPLQQRPTFTTKYPQKHVPLRGDILRLIYIDFIDIYKSLFIIFYVIKLYQYSNYRIIMSNIKIIAVNKQTINQLFNSFKKHWENLRHNENSLSQLQFNQY